ncbi:MAG: sigma 54-interacting transcriptional regulator [Planctomycetota bacterium]
MSFFDASQRNLVGAVAELAFCNPFEPRRIDAERRALGRDGPAGSAVWSLDAGSPEGRPELRELADRLAPALSRARAKLAEGAKPSPADLAAYEDATLYLLYDRYRDRLEQLYRTAAAGRGQGRGTTVKWWPAFEAEFDHLLRPAGAPLVTDYEPAHVLACFFQIRRAFDAIFTAIVGRSPCLASLRARCWESVFTADLRAYYRGLYRKMDGFPTLIVGPTGTGKELVAGAIGRSRYIAFDADTRRFTEKIDGGFFALNPAALPTPLIESELFGHVRGAFTGAVCDHTGYLEACPPRGAVFLDEIGELDPAVQVKLLRVLQTRTFSRVGETRSRTFAGKLIAATHRDLPGMMADGGFRTDFYYRLCADVVRTPSLREVLDGRPDDLQDLVRFLATQAAGDSPDAEALTQRALDCVHRSYGRAYAWPGNVRELEQCVRAHLIRRDYVPFCQEKSPKRVAKDWDGLFERADATAESVLSRYAQRVYEKSGTYAEAARVMDLDRRTVKRLLDAARGASEMIVTAG